jgi:hypothetical protein
MVQICLYWDANLLLNLQSFWRMISHLKDFHEKFIHCKCSKGNSGILQEYLGTGFLFPVHFPVVRLWWKLTGILGYRVDIFLNKGFVTKQGNPVRFTGILVQQGWIKTNKSFLMSKFYLWKVCAVFTSVGLVRLTSLGLSEIKSFVQIQWF